MEAISIDVSHLPLHPDVATLRITGVLYAGTISYMQKTLEGIMAEKKKLVCDLSETKYISSGGWSLLLSSFRKLRDTGGIMVLACMKPEVNDAFELLEYHKVVPSYPSVETALKEGFSNPAIQGNK